MLRPTIQKPGAAKTSAFGANRRDFLRKEKATPFASLFDYPLAPSRRTGVPLFSKNREIQVQSFILKLVNNNCPELRALRDGPRLEGRAELVVVVAVVPLEKGKLLNQQAFTAITKEFSTTGLSIVLREPKGLEEVILGFRWEGEMTYVRAEAKHLNPMGGGFYQLGCRMIEVVRPDAYPGLETFSF